MMLDFCIYNKLIFIHCFDFWKKCNHTTDVNKVFYIKFIVSKKLNQDSTQYFSGFCWWLTITKLPIDDGLRQAPKQLYIEINKNLRIFWHHPINSTVDSDCFCSVKQALGNFWSGILQASHVLTFGSLMFISLLQISQSICVFPSVSAGYKVDLTKCILS